MSEKEKTFKVAQVRILLDDVFADKITFSRFVEILNELADKSNIDAKLQNDYPLIFEYLMK